MLGMDDASLMDEQGLFDAGVLKKKFSKGELIELVRELQAEKNRLKEQNHYFNNLQDRVVDLERSQFLFEQYGRRESIEITGIPDSVAQKDLQGEVIQVFKEAKVAVEHQTFEV